MTLSAEDKKGIKSEFGRSSKDTGSPEVQVAILTKRINELTAISKNMQKIITLGEVCCDLSVGGESCWTI